MAIETKPWDAAEILTTPGHVAAYIEAYLEDGTAEEIREALRTVARSRGMAAVARASDLSREALYKALGPNGNPTLDTLLRVTKALGVRLAADPSDPEDFDATSEKVGQELEERRERAPTKEQVALRLDKDVLEKLRAGGPGWQARVNSELRKVVGL